MRLRHLAMSLSKLHPHPCENVDLEQYSTDGNIASKFISSIVSYGDLSPYLRKTGDGLDCKIPHGKINYIISSIKNFFDEKLFYSKGTRLYRYVLSTGTYVRVRTRTRTCTGQYGTK